jgi:trimeric autotransporter adhesin
VWTAGLGLLASAGVTFAQQYTISTVAGGVPPATPVAAAGISVGQPQRVTVDSAGNLYFTSLNCVFEVVGGTLTLIAGNSRAGYSGDGGPATQAQLNAPQGMAIDPYGDIFIADTGNNVVREVTPDGKINTFAGNGTVGYTGDQGPANQAQLHAPAGVAVDNSGNLYIADTGNNTIRWVTPDGNIQTLAGDGYASFYGDTGSPSSATLNHPEDVTLGLNGNIYIADTGNGNIRLVVGGVITSVAGTETWGYAGDGGAATSAALYAPRAVTADSSGNYYIADYGNHRIRKVDTKGNIITVVGNGNQGFSGDGGPAGNAELNFPSGVVIDSQGNIYIADSGNNRIRKVSTSGTISTVAGNGIFSDSGDGGPPAAAQLNAPTGVVVTPAGALYISDSLNAAVRVAAKGTISSVGSASSLGSPRGLAYDAAGNVYVADAANSRVQKIGTDGSVTTFAGNGTAGFAGDGGPAASAQLNTPTSVVVDTAGNVYIADLLNNRIRKVDTSGTISTVAGSAFQGYSGDGGPAVLAGLNLPQGVTADTQGDLYIADTANNLIRIVTPDGNIHSFAGTGITGYSGDGGPAINAQITGPTGIAADLFGNIYFIDGSAYIREIYPSGAIQTIAGNGTTGYTGDAGIATLAELNAPTAVAVDQAGNVYVADTGNNAVRLLEPTGSGLVVTQVTNAASNQPGPISPGEVLVLTGSGLGPSQLQLYQASGGFVPTSLAGTTVLFGGTPAPVIYTSPGQVSVVVPFEISGQDVQIVVQNQGQSSAPVGVPIAAAAPGLFTTNFTGQGQAAALNGNQQANGAANPAARGSLISLFATGGGQTSPPSTDGSLSGTPAPLSANVAVTIGGQPATVSYAGSAPGQEAGIVEITVQVPSNIQPGSAVPVTLQIGSASAPSGVTVAIE